MTLPKLVTPEFETVIPSSKEKIKFRPFLVKEEKILYMALESGDANDIKNGVIQILDSCILTPGIKVNELASYDVEYIFLRLRAKSVGEIIKVNVKHPDSDCTHETMCEINLDEVEVLFDEKHTDKIDLGNGVGIKMKMPSLDKILSLVGDDDVENLFELVLNAIQFIYDEKDVYEEFTKKELEDFIESLTKEQFEKVQEFFSTAPKLYYDVHWVCEECGKPDTVRLEGLQSFFT